MLTQPLLGGDIDAVGVGVVGQYVGDVSDLLVVDHGSVGQVDGDQCGVGFTANEHHLVGEIESLAVRAVAAGCGDSFCHSEFDGVHEG